MIVATAVLGQTDRSVAAIKHQQPLRPPPHTYSSHTHSHEARWVKCLAQGHNDQDTSGWAGIEPPTLQTLPPIGGRAGRPMGRVWTPKYIQYLIGFHHKEGRSAHLKVFQICQPWHFAYLEYAICIFVWSETVFLVLKRAKWSRSATNTAPAYINQQQVCNREWMYCFQCSLFLPTSSLILSMF